MVTPLYTAIGKVFRNEEFAAPQANLRKLLQHYSSQVDSAAAKQT